MSRPRPYRKKARAVAEEQTGEAILDAAVAAFSAEPFDRVTLQEIAGQSGVTVQTVIRRFGSKEELFEQMAEREGNRIIRSREVPGEKGLAGALEALVRHYERDGDMICNLVSQEQLFEPVTRVVTRGRQVHREWVEQHCAHLLEGLTAEARTRMLHAAIAATDLSTWKLLRRDYNLKPEQVTAIMTQLLNSLRDH